MAETTILPKGSLAGEDNESKMLKAESKKNSYFFDYEAKTPGQPLVRSYFLFVLYSINLRLNVVLTLLNHLHTFHRRTFVPSSQWRPFQVQLVLPS